MADQVARHRSLKRQDESVRHGKARLFVLFNDPDTAVRTDAVRALGDIGDARAVDFLLTALNDLDVRPMAVEAPGIGERRRGLP